MIKKLSGTFRRKSISSTGSTGDDDLRTSFASQASKGSAPTSHPSEKSRRPPGGLEDLAAAYRRVLADHNAARNEAKAIREARGALDRKDASRTQQLRDVNISSTRMAHSNLQDAILPQRKDKSPKLVRRSGRMLVDGPENDIPGGSSPRGLKENAVVKMTGTRRSRRYRLQESASRAKSMESPAMSRGHNLEQNSVIYDREKHVSGDTADITFVAHGRGTMRAYSMVENESSRAKSVSGDIPFFAEDGNASFEKDGAPATRNTAVADVHIIEQRRNDPASASHSISFDMKPRQPPVSTAKPPKKPVEPATGAVRRVAGSKEAAGVSVEPRTKTVPVMVVAGNASDDLIRRGKHPRQQSFAVGDDRLQPTDLSSLPSRSKPSSTGSKLAEPIVPRKTKQSNSSDARNTSPLSSQSSSSTPESPGYSDRSDPSNSVLGRAGNSRNSGQSSALERHRPCRWSVNGLAPDNYAAISQRRDRAEAKGLVSACSVLEIEVLAIEERAAEIASNTDEAAFLESRASSLRRALAILEDRYDSIEDFYLKGREYAHAMGRFYQVSPEEYDRWTRAGHSRSRSSARSSTSSHERVPCASPTVPNLPGVDNITRMSLR